ncbi:sugar phosphate isomerase/epimerase family protein [Mesorhizobium sophorae]|uniref:sugar phosphate isomerase/epimerase family protein n=1 Tax=Mesorhizobium sophorae TaxID=1300294 RepID=UPI000BA4682A|nr:sugar phosphate isomerase/epimerase [Mesorhizobium sophorae]
MRLGFYTNYTPELASFAKETGFNSLELSAWPESSLNADKVTAGDCEKIKQDLKSKDIEISALGYYPNPLSHHESEAKEAQRYLKKVIDLAANMSIPVVATFAGRDGGKTVKENLPLFKETFSPIMDHAEKRGIKIAIENCPMMNRFTMQGENIAFSPEIWAAMFDLVPSKYLGLEFDPSHCVWQGIDYLKAVYDFGDKIFHVHAKDMEIRQDVLGKAGIYGLALSDVDGLGSGWWRARAPGWGQVDWAKFITALIEVGYHGNIDIEHEDDVFALANKIGGIQTEYDIVNAYGTETQGLQLGFKTLSKYIPTV